MPSVLSRHIVARLQLRIALTVSQFRFATEPAKGLLQSRSVSGVRPDNVLPNSTFDD
jgi:hypothetical protein